MTTVLQRLVKPYDLLLDDTAGWRALEMDEISTHDGRLSLNPLESLTPKMSEPNGTFGGHSLPRGVAIWGDDIIMSDPVRHLILRWRYCDGEPWPLATLGGYEVNEEGDYVPTGEAPRSLDTPLGITINLRNDLVIADSGNNRVIVLTLPGLAIRRVVGPLKSPVPEEGGGAGPVDSEAADWVPVDVSTGPTGALYVADANGFIWKLDSQGRPELSYVGRLPDGWIPRRVLVDAESRAYVVCDGIDGPEDIVILDRRGRLMPQIGQLQGEVDRWLELHIPDIMTNAREGGSLEEEAEARASLLPRELSELIDLELAATAKLIEEEALAQIRSGSESTRLQLETEIWQSQRNEVYDSILTGAYHGLLPEFIASVLPESRLVLDGDQINLRWADDCPTTAEPMKTGLAIDSDGRLELGGDSSGPYLIHRPPVAQYQTSGLFRTEALDSGRLGNTWHRVVMEMDAPERTSVRLFSFTSDVLRPDVSPKGSEDEPLPTEGWMSAPDNSEEWLVQSGPGRYLYLAVALNGPGDRTPYIDRIFTYAHRESSLKYLPAAYHADESGRDVLDRLLSLTDTVFGEIESEIEVFPSRLDVGGAPADFLPWLASWFDLTLEKSWTEDQRRKAIKNIVTLYRWRGTIYGLRMLLQLHCRLEEPMPQVVEHFRGENLGVDQSEGQAVSAAMRLWLGQPSGDPSVHFTVVLPENTIDTDEKRYIVQRLIEANKPAHTRHSLRPLVAGVRLSSETSCGAALGIDARLGSPKDWVLPEEDGTDMPLIGGNVLPSSPSPSAALILGQTRLRSSRYGISACHSFKKP
ncbi:MAG: hypothetical protein IIA92_04410 [Chloroflexi bacterium]|nr:hypothetical protein [Chloroflexota bacterium]